jgi:hypothetical protein
MPASAVARSRFAVRAGRLAALPARDWLLVLQLAGLGLATRVALGRVPLPRLVELMARRARHPGLRLLPVGLGRRDATRLARLADLAARLVPGQGRCLTRSLLLFWLLSAREERVELVVGVDRPDGRFRSHAWVEVARGGTPEAPTSFAPILRLAGGRARGAG